jgi:hypothetical protein
MSGKLQLDAACGSAAVRPLSARLADTARLLSMMASGEARLCRAEVALAAKTLLACTREVKRIEADTAGTGRRTHER